MMEVENTCQRSFLDRRHKYVLKANWVNAVKVKCGFSNSPDVVSVCQGGSPTSQIYEKS